MCQTGSELELTAVVNLNLDELQVISNMPLFHPARKYLQVADRLRDSIIELSNDRPGDLQGLFSTTSTDGSLGGVENGWLVPGWQCSRTACD